MSIGNEICQRAWISQSQVIHLGWKLHSLSTEERKLTDYIEIAPLFALSERIRDFSGVGSANALQLGNGADQTNKQTTVLS